MRVTDKVQFTKRGFKLPSDFQFSAKNMSGNIFTIGNSIHIHVGSYMLKAAVPGAKFRPYSSDRDIKLYKGAFYLNVPASIREQLPEEVNFHLLMDVDNI